MLFNNLRIGENYLLDSYIKLQNESWPEDKGELQIKAVKQGVKNNLSNWYYYGYNNKNESNDPEILIIFLIKAISAKLPFYLTDFTIRKDHRGKSISIEWFKEWIASPIGDFMSKHGIYLDCTEESFDKLYQHMGFKIVCNLNENIILIRLKNE